MNGSIFLEVIFFLQDCPLDISNNSHKVKSNLAGVELKSTPLGSGKKKIAGMQGVAKLSEKKSLVDIFFCCLAGKQDGANRYFFAEKELGKQSCFCSPFPF